MDTLQGTVSNCQHTLRVSGGGGSNNPSTTTTYIALFRVNSHPVEFRTNRPSSVSDNDQVVVAGTTRNGSLRAFACRNVTTGEVLNSGLWGNVFAAIFLPVVLLIITGIASVMFGQYALLAGIILIVALVTYLIRQVVLTKQATNLVRA